MTFISYAQNHEDVMLWRALKHVENGFYIDVGANHPADDSVTKAFYDRGWSGINIEPLAEHIRQLAADRPRDLNLQVAMGATEGEIEFFETSVRGLATASASVAEMHAAAGLATVRHVVPVMRLDRICAEHAKGDIHFLKIDVEGFEQQVIEGMDFGRFRPWIVVVEATIPNSQNINASWEPQILGAGYDYVYFDGLNRYYVAREHAELKAAFGAPPNVFDGFISAENHRLNQLIAAAEAAAAQALELAREAEAQAYEAETEAREAEDRAWKAEEKAWHAEEKTREMEAALQAVHTSTSWRVTKPLRQLVTTVRQLRQHGAAATGHLRSKALATGLKVGKTGAALLDAHPRVRRLGGKAARALGIHHRLLSLHFSLRNGQAAPLLPGCRNPQDLGRFNPAVIPNQPCPPEALFLEGGVADDFWFRFIGHVEGHYSLAIVNRGLAVALDDLSGHKLAFQPYHGKPYDKPSDLPASQRAALEAMFGRAVPADAGGRTISIAHHFPLIADGDQARHRFIVFFWEETSVPADTVRHINENFDAVLAATDFVKRALRNSGCRLPIFVVSMGIDHLVGRDEAPIENLAPAAGAPFRFLHISSVFERKGPDVLLQAYFGQFTASDPVELYIKTFPNPHNRIREQVAAFCHGRPDAPRVVIDEAPLDDAGMVALYRSAQALVLPTRGEGFNLPAAEALALGLPVIVTGYGAHVDFCTRATASLIPFRFSKSVSHVKSADACWVDPDPEELGRQMRRLQAEVMAGDGDLERRRQAGMRHVRHVYSWQQSARAVQEAAHWLDAEAPAGQPGRLAVLSPWSTRCGIAEYSLNLLGAFDAAWATKIYCDQRTEAAPEQSLYQPTWKIGDNASVCATLDRIRREGHDVLLVQHQPSLFGLTDAVCEGLAAIRAAGCVVILELHSTLPLLLECRLTARSIAALRSIDRIVVHKAEDLNHLLELGLANNVFLLNHGVTQPLPPESAAAPRSAWGIGEDDLVIGCFGFILPHKGIDTLVECIEPLSRATGRRVHLLGLNSILDARSEGTLRQYQKRAAALGVDDCITWITDYRPIRECIQLLGMADYILFPYKETRESASGAVTIGAAALKPVLVSPLHIFSDLAECTFRMEGDGVQDIVDAIVGLEKDPEAARQQVERQRAWLAERDWARISSRLEAVVQGLRVDRRLAGAVAERRDQFVAANAEAREAQILVDVSELYFRDARTGIQRVVRSILGELLAAPPAGFRIRPIYGTADQGYRYTNKFLPAGAEGDEHPVKVGAGDIFLGLDLSAHLFPQAEAALKEFRLAGARIHFVVYDIIPLRYPQYTVAGIGSAFETWLHSLARQADSLVCISAAVADDVRNWLNEHAEAYPLPEVRHFHLGADIENSAPSTGLPADADAVLERIGAGPAFLTVGTVEPRKGQVQTLAAFEQLWSRGEPARLVLVGKEGWMMGDFAAKLRSHPELGKRLFWLEGVSDEYLERVYGAATCLIAASETEGFGLPLIEAAQHKLPIIARDIPVFREVAGDHAYYFSGQEPEALAKAVRAWLGLSQGGRAPRSDAMPWLTWRQSTRNLLDSVLCQ